MSRPPRDLEAERSAIRTAADRLLAGTPLRSESGKLSATELIAESGLARWKVYEHRDLVEEFQARVKAQDTMPEAMQELAAENKRLKTELTEVRAELEAERAHSALLRRVVAETSIELEEARLEQEENVNVTRLPAVRRPGRASLFHTEPG